jgi:hypothetical protein
MYTELAVDFIKIYGSLIERIFHESLDTWFRTATFDGLEHKNRTKSNFLWDAVIHKLRSELADNTDFHFIDKNGTVFIAYRQIFLIRIKKLGVNRRPSSIQTRQSDRFQNQLDLGLGDYTNVYLNYSLDKLGIIINSIRLQCENGKTVLWSYLIDDSLNTTNIVGLFPEAQKTEDIRIRLKNPQEAQDGKAI